MANSGLRTVSVQMSGVQRWVPLSKVISHVLSNAVSDVVHSPKSQRPPIIDSMPDFDSASGRLSFTSAALIIADSLRKAPGVDGVLMAISGSEWPFIPAVRGGMATHQFSKT